ncbi:MAG: hypothetical protein E7614_09015 [Ruminococcaceae bacterium]|nr:hypothetical protein [Oscillospiraceae bacterium]
MKNKKLIIAMLMAFGLTLVCLFFVLIFIDASGIKIIGGAGLPTFMIFFRKYLFILILGLISLVSALVVKIVSNLKK